MNGKTEEQIRDDLSFLDDGEAVSYGSYVTGEFRPGSDIDVAVVTRTENREENLELQRDLMGKAPRIYDVRVFELLPLKVRATAMSDYEVLFGEEPEISEYFYWFRKRWEDQKRRILSGY
ncbi:MAG: hypothetical protein MAG715_00966 [Methanonatronarchaeales archaeon]|nr:hypothetical protein [Methanonatronarchaeales archaeon]